MSYAIPSLTRVPATEKGLTIADFLVPVRVGERTSPRLRDVVGTNDCRISVHAAASGRVVVFSALDNLLKGAAGQAVQNLNLALGWEETAGLPVEERR
jgi:N-acetyl-gamma-glutamylphosphate reductase